MLKNIKKYLHDIKIKKEIKRIYNFVTYKRNYDDFDLKSFNKIEKEINEYFDTHMKEYSYNYYHTIINGLFYIRNYLNEKGV